ncbi:hypothetical protein Scep_029301 [Stephania cephalantha]|uniref:Uncharacterized protein n=1 Tax=Stephania cephalantha TaxID=152367 RepID=A0AAP0HHG3_9MAGN
MPTEGSYYQPNSRPKRSDGLPTCTVRTKAFILQKFLSVENQEKTASQAYLGIVARVSGSLSVQIWVSWGVGGRLEVRKSIGMPHRIHDLVYRFRFSCVTAGGHTWVCAAVAFGIGVAYKEGVGKASLFLLASVLTRHQSATNASLSLNSNRFATDMSVLAGLQSATDLELGDRSSSIGELVGIDSGVWGSRSACLVDLDPGIDYGVVERVVRFVKPNGKTLDAPSTSSHRRCDLTATPSVTQIHPSVIEGRARCTSETTTSDCHDLHLVDIEVLQAFAAPLVCGGQQALQTVRKEQLGVPPVPQVVDFNLGQPLERIARRSFVAGSKPRVTPGLVGSCCNDDDLAKLWESVPACNSMQIRGWLERIVLARKSELLGVLVRTDPKASETFISHFSLSDVRISMLDQTGQIAQWLKCVRSPSPHLLISLDPLCIVFLEAYPLTAYHTAYRRMGIQGHPLEIQAYYINHGPNTSIIGSIYTTDGITIA